MRLSGDTAGIADEDIDGPGYARFNGANPLGALRSVAQIDAIHHDGVSQDQSAISQAKTRALVREHLADGAAKRLCPAAHGQDAVVEVAREHRVFVHQRLLPIISNSPLVVRNPIHRRRRIS